VIEALRAKRRAVLEVWMPGALSTPGLQELAAVARASGVRVHRVVSASQVAARAEPLPEQPFEALLTDPAPRRIVALDRITDAGNLGSIARSALGAGFRSMLLEHRQVAALGPGALRASAGALEYVRIGRAPSLRRALALARGEGLRILVADAAGPPIDRVPASVLAGEVIWLFGSEDRGARASIQEPEDLRVGIPMEGEISTLGVAAAAAYLLHRTAEVARRAGPVARRGEMP
jgi:23S rRNA (guanosine2251-2'-O)-methyltransferase